MNFLAILFALLQVGTAPSASNPIARIRAKTPVEDVSSLDAVHIAGVFKNPGKSLIKRIGPALSGDILYLFPDGTYIYCEWSDISPETISDKSAWTYSQGLVQLASDPEVKWNAGIDRQLIALRRSSVQDEVLLIEVTGLPYFEQKAGDDPESMLLIVAKERSKPIPSSEAPKIKASLMKKFWNPKFHSQP
ncbi:MAG: hypothetical protein DMG43_15745 [Acidobacteria bacterium]|nr:MAG: hypothetical protein DMG43_15745 [Acidobacteriota bacterium]